MTHSEFAVFSEKLKQEKRKLDLILKIRAHTKEQYSHLGLTNDHHEHFKTNFHRLYNKTPPKQSILSSWWPTRRKQNKSLEHRQYYSLYFQ